MNQEQCQACQAPVWHAQHELTRKTVTLDRDPKPGGTYVVVRDMQGRLVVRSVYGRPAARDDQHLFTAHSCGAGSGTGNYEQFVVAPD
ncbi:hypothetical protein [Arthrobacter globiformis]|uniref:hypothetical protein n=1 Tax=Arthrobacter globiformis TaxID=1665 RepID=UPI001551F3D8|nr:hypothetical protein [Arthrobacter globiformis]